MPGLFGGGASQPQVYHTPATQTYGGQPNYVPTQQPAADQNYNNIVNALLGTGFANLGAYAPQITGYGNQQQSAAQQVNNQAPGVYQQGANNAFQIGSLVPSLVGAGQGGYNQLQPLTQQITASAFDPQNALYQQLQNQATQQSQAANAAAGVSGPYAASTTAQNLNNLALNWQNQQLGRETQGAAAAGGNVLNALNTLFGGTQAGTSAAGAGTSLFGNAGQNLFSQGGYGNQAIGNTLSSFNNLYQLPQQTLQDLQSYLGLGQSGSSLAQGAAGLGLQGGQQGYNQLTQSLGGLGIGGGLLLNSLGLNPLQTGGLSSAIGSFGGADAGLGLDPFTGGPVLTQGSGLLGFLGNLFGGGAAVA